VEKLVEFNSVKIKKKTPFPKELSFVIRIALIACSAKQGRNTLKDTFRSAS
jgi:hypothetical protein